VTTQRLPTRRIRILKVDFEFHPFVFPISALLMLTFVIITVIWPARALMLFKQIHNWIVSHFAWLYIPSLSFFVILAIYLVVSRYAHIRLGPDDSRPEFSQLSWFTMLFSAGMGIGMIFFGVVEPMTHYLHPPSGEPISLQSAISAMAITLFHWGLHPWALYGFVGLSLGYFGFRRGLPLSFRSVFYPLFGRYIYYKIGDIIDIIAVLATLFGLATSLGLGAQQINAGLHYVFHWPPQTVFSQLTLILVITSIACLSLVSGLHIGIKWLSNTNLCLAGVLLACLFAFGPTIYLLSSGVENMGAYLSDIVFRSFWTASYTSESKSQWVSSWTIFYWGWWLSWSPYVGGFIARISRGRTIREFVIGVLLVPMAVTLIWMTGFGNSSLYQDLYKNLNVESAQTNGFYRVKPQPYPVQQRNQASGLPISANEKWWTAPVGPKDVHVKIKPGQIHTTQKGQQYYYTANDTPVTFQNGVLVNLNNHKPFWPAPQTRFTGQFKHETRTLNIVGFIDSPVLNEQKNRTLDTTATSLFVMLSAYPFSSVLSTIAVISITLFFITSSDSASLVADIIASGGTAHPTTGTRVFWALLEGLLAASLLTAGGTVALQTGAITLGLPLCFGLLLASFALLRGLHLENQGQIPDWQKRYISADQ